ncbi:MAG: sulfite exporter TauE/SafE family protein [Hydrogenophaga sp.]|nr:sulfite exporter TauE/SafE family protein [Hydrogenophaga sp.]
MPLAVFVLAGVVKGVVGLGLPTVAMALLALTMTPAQAAALLIVPSLVTNLWQLRPWHTLGTLLRRLVAMQAGVCVGTLAGAWWMGAPAGPWAGMALGVALLAYGFWSLAGFTPTLTPRAQRLLGPVAGALTGLVTAATGVFVVPAVPYLQALRLERDTLVQAMGLSFTVSTLAWAIGLRINGVATSSVLGPSLLMLPAALLGMALGQRLRQRMAPVLFRRCFLGALMLLGLYLVVRAV